MDSERLESSRTKTYSKKTIMSNDELDACICGGSFQLSALLTQPDACIAPRMRMHSNEKKKKSIPKSWTTLNIVVCAALSNWAAEHRSTPSLRIGHSLTLSDRRDCCYIIFLVRHLLLHSVSHLYFLFIVSTSLLHLFSRFVRLCVCVQWVTDVIVIGWLKLFVTVHWIDF